MKDGGNAKSLGLTEKKSFHGDTPSTHGMSSVGPNNVPGMTGNKPQGNPPHKCGDGVHTIK